ncbi:hypothetical protein [Paraburkholderia fungorum]|uniref:hypothetical protein n=1 Tax=Paraburkholderia fungorum TaxID=134537 RepID=UPI003D6C4AEA
MRSRTRSASWNATRPTAHLADEQVEAACNIWDRALVTGEWPSYPLEAYTATPKSWDLTSWEERAMTDDTLNPMEIGA